ncbi:MAG: holin family protein [Gemmobacter sp.]|uniref:holin family protein n=1 Tax=Gemmobacter sp. TaxID=1898957 RepID=UPI00391C0BBC
MGMIARVLGGPGAVATLGRAAREVAEVFTPNATRALELAHDSGAAALAQHGAEFVQAPQGWFDHAVNGLNRLPRPMLALGTLGLFVYAMADPEGFGLRMAGLALVPEPLWWLLGAIVAFYFGARETHYLRHRTGAGGGAGRAVPPPHPPRTAPSDGAPGPEGGEGAPDNPALAQWMHAAGDR